MMKLPFNADGTQDGALGRRFDGRCALRAFVAALLLAFALLWCDFAAALAPSVAHADESAEAEELVVDENDDAADEVDEAVDVDDDQMPELAEEPGTTSVDTSDSNYVDPAQTADNSFIYDTSIASLAQEASFHDGQTVQVVGEVVGDRVATGTPGHYWITIEAEEKNDSSSISAYVTETQAEIIDHYGRYGVVGTRVQARGVYHQACDEHDGLADIHVVSLEVVRAGYETADEFVMREFLPGFVLLAVGLALVVLFRIVRERSR